MQHAIGDHALLADSRTAALVDPDGNIAWCCWPRVDSAPLLMSILDDSHGGFFTVRPAGDAALESRAYLGASLVLRTEWRAGAARLVVDDALIPGDAPCLLRVVRARDGDVDVAVSFSPAHRATREQISVVAQADALVVEHEGRAVTVAAPGTWNLDQHGPVGSCTLRVRSGETAAIALQPLGDVIVRDAAPLERTLAAWRRRLQPLDSVRILPQAATALGEGACRSLLERSAAVMLGLLRPGGGIVAAPTTSLPQWPGSARCWDYRYCWLRDASLAALALLRGGFVDEARALGDFLGAAVSDGGIRPVMRVDGGAPPPETQVDGVPGYRGAHPVRIGNAAAEQVQLDVGGEVVELAAALAAVDALPPALAAAATVLGNWTQRHWREPDHGIWEIRGQPQRYTHSRLMAWVALRDAAALAERGRVQGDAAAWGRTADDVRHAILSRPGALQLHAEGGGADAALALAATTGLIAPDDPRCLATLDLIARRLHRGSLLDRYEGQPDTLADPCAPFVFPTFWMATAERAAGRDAGPRLRAAASAAGGLGLFGEVVDPATGGPLGNYPQVQSHAAAVLAVTAPS